MSISEHMTEKVTEKVLPLEIFKIIYFKFSGSTRNLSIILYAHVNVKGVLESKYALEFR